VRVAVKNKTMKNTLSMFGGLLILVFFWIQFFYEEPPKEYINGVSLVSPPRPIGDTAYVALREVNANFVAIIPYAFCPKDRPVVIFNHERQWWGERVDGMAQMVADAKKNGLAVMVKPHLWVRQDGWPGDLQFDESGWNSWEKDYRDYILQCAKVADSLKVEMFCIGTEVRYSAAGRPYFWKKLIAEVRDIYPGKLTYAANWDNYQKISFWEDLDYIGVDAYWPLDSSASPTKEQLISSWQPIREELSVFSERLGKSVIFTEYGYQSVKGTTSRPWERRRDGVDLQTQALAYEVMYDVFWEEKWFAGGFLWKWHLTSRRGGEDDPSFTPQGKPALSVVQKRYGNDLSD
jgi:hypothetical protein